MKLRVLVFFLWPLLVNAQNVSLKDTLRILCLGDSYTIGESVAANGRWPEQLKDSLVQQGFVVDTLAIIATTGWRTDDLLNAISGKGLETKSFNLVSLLIGVNNFYQAKPFSQYQNEFPALRDSALRYADNDKNHVFVVSIPDYAYTPFGQQSPTPQQISNGIDQYNLYNKMVTDTAGISYMDITPISRQGLQNASYVAGDDLHPSTVQYTEWVKLMLTRMHPEILTGIHEQDPKSLFTIYPNPCAEYTKISFSSGRASSSTYIRLFGSDGSFLLQEKFSSETSYLNVSQLSPGFYTCEVCKDARCFYKKLIVVH